MQRTLIVVLVLLSLTVSVGATPLQGRIVLGENAQMSDMLGAADIAASMQMTNGETTLGAASLSGDVKAIYGGNLQVRKKPFFTLMPGDMKGLADGTITTQRGTTRYEQYVSEGSQAMSVNFIENDDDLHDFLVIDDTSYFLAWHAQFPEGLASRITDGELEDLKDVSFNILGSEYTITSAQVSASGSDLSISLMGGSVADTLREGETRTYTIDGKDHEVTLVFVSDPNSANPKAKFSVDGELTDSMAAGETDTLSGGLQIGVRDVLVNARDGVVSFYLGAKKLVLEDDTPLVEGFDGTAEVESENLNDASVEILGSLESNSTFRIKWIKYRISMDAAEGSALYMLPGHGVKEMMRHPEGILGAFDIRYEGLAPNTYYDVSFETPNKHEYRLDFTNVNKVHYEIPLLTNKNGVWKYGTEDDDLVFVEGANAGEHNIGMHDYFIISNAKSSSDADKSVTDVLRYTDYDSSTGTIEFERQSDGSSIKVPLSDAGAGYLVIGGHTFDINVSDPAISSPDLSVDLDADGGYGDVMNVVTYGGLVVDIAKKVYVNDSFNATHATLSQIVGNGKTISGAIDFTAGSGFVQMGSTMLAKHFSTPSTDEVMNWTISQATSNEVDLALSDTDFDGPYDGTGDNYEFRLESDPENDDMERAITDYGMRIAYSTPSSSPSELVLSVPKDQQMVKVYLTIGPTAYTQSVASQKIVPLKDVAVLDDVTLLGKEDLIVIGGPCVNKIAAILLNSTDDCAAGFTPGEPMVETFPVNGTSVLLIAGYDAADTLAASKEVAWG